MAKENRRVKLTKMLLDESFLSFLAKKPLSRITITEICEEADINRSTYYKHYSDPYDQLEKIENELIGEMSKYVDALIDEGIYGDRRQHRTIKRILEYMQMKKSVFQVLFDRSDDLNFIKDIQVFFGKRIFRDFNPEKSGDLKNAYRYIYISTGNFGILQHWIRNEMSVDIDTMADWITEFSTANFQGK